MAGRPVPVGNYSGTKRRPAPRGGGAGNVGATRTRGQNYSFGMKSKNLTPQPRAAKPRSSSGPGIFGQSGKGVNNARKQGQRGGIAPSFYGRKGN